MPQIAPSEKIQLLEQQHVLLLNELAALNDRLEQALSGENNREISNDE